MLTRALRAFGWTLVAVGAVLLLYVIYQLFYTNLETDRAQAELQDSWGGPLPGEPVAAEPEDPGPLELGAAYAAIWFERPGSDTPLVREDPVFVVHGVSLDLLRRGPGHYPDSAAPGEAGNFAVAGHRTTYGAPFYHLDQLRQDDRIHVLDREGRHWRYDVRESRIVLPGATWVVGNDPLEDGSPMMTLTTCHPRFSAAQRLIVFADLAGQVDADGGLVPFEHPEEPGDDGEGEPGGEGPVAEQAAG